MSDYRVEETQFGTKTSHPSYGTLAFSRRTGGATPLFGSSIEHRDTIAMTLYHADITRGLHEDHVYGNKVIAELIEFEDIDGNKDRYECEQYGYKRVSLQVRISTPTGRNERLVA